MYKITEIKSKVELAASVLPIEKIVDIEIISSVVFNDIRNLEALLKTI